MDVCNQSTRNGCKPRLIVLHDTESHDHPGNGDLQAIGSWFDNPEAQASAHVCVDGEGRSARYVHDEAKAWHVADFNATALGIEQVGFATFHTDDWTKNDRAQIKKVAKYIAYWSRKFDIPIGHGMVNPLAGSVIRPGVVTHGALGERGGGHHDPGADYPLEAVLMAARYYRRAGWPGI